MTSHVTWGFQLYFPFEGSTFLVLTIQPTFVWNRTEFFCVTRNPNGSVNCNKCDCNKWVSFSNYFFIFNLFPLFFYNKTTIKCNISIYVSTSCQPNVNVICWHTISGYLDRWMFEIENYNFFFCAEDCRNIMRK